MPEKELDKLIEVVRQAFTDAGKDITFAEAIGALELIKLDLYQEAQNDSIKADNV